MCKLHKHSQPETTEVLCQMLNNCLQREAHIISTFKTGSQNYCSHYRGISETVSTARLYGKVLKHNYRKIPGQERTKWLLSEKIFPG